MIAKTPSTHGHHTIRALSYALAGIAGVTLGLLFAPKEGSEFRHDIMEKAKELSKHFNKNREQLQEDIKEIWGEVTDELEKDYVELRSSFLATIDDVKDKANFTFKKYEEIVDDVVTEFTDDRGWTHSQKNKLAKHLKNEWESMKDHFSFGSEEQEDEKD